MDENEKISVQDLIDTINVLNDEADVLMKLVHSSMRTLSLYAQGETDPELASMMCDEIETALVKLYNIDRKALLGGEG